MNRRQSVNDMIYEITTAMLAILVIGGAIVITIINVELHGAFVDPPGWLQTAVGAVIGFYFARRTDAQARLGYLAALEEGGAKLEQDGR